MSPYTFYREGGGAGWVDADAADYNEMFVGQGALSSQAVDGCILYNKYHELDLVKDIHVCNGVDSRPREREREGVIDGVGCHPPMIIREREGCSRGRVQRSRRNFFQLLPK